MLCLVWYDPGKADWRSFPEGIMHLGPSVHWSTLLNEKYKRLATLMSKWLQVATKDPLKKKSGHWPEVEMTHQHCGTELFKSNQTHFLLKKGKWHLQNLKNKQFYFKWHKVISWENIKQSAYKYFVNIKYCTSLINPYKGYNPLIRGTNKQSSLVSAAGAIKPVDSVLFSGTKERVHVPLRKPPANPQASHWKQKPCAKDDNIKVFSSNCNNTLRWH